MRSFLLIPILLAIACAIGAGACRAFGSNPHAKELIAAAMTCLIAGEVGMIPLLLARGGNQAAVAQAALVGTVLHLFVSITVAGIAVFARVGLSSAFLYWLLALYWVTLIGLVVAFVKAVRSAPIAQAK